MTTLEPLTPAIAEAGEHQRPPRPLPPQEAELASAVKAPTGMSRACGVMKVYCCWSAGTSSTVDDAAERGAASRPTPARAGRGTTCSGRPTGCRPADRRATGLSTMPVAASAPRRQRRSPRKYGGGSTAAELGRRPAPLSGHGAASAGPTIRDRCRGRRGCPAPQRSMTSPLRMKRSPSTTGGPDRSTATRRRCSARVLFTAWWATTGAATIAKATSSSEVTLPAVHLPVRPRGPDGSCSPARSPGEYGSDPTPFRPHGCRGPPPGDC